MTTSDSKGRFFLQNESIRIDSNNESNQIESIRIANWNALRLWLLTGGGGGLVTAAAGSMSWAYGTMDTE